MTVMLTTVMTKYKLDKIDENAYEEKTGKNCS